MLWVSRTLWGFLVLPPSQPFPSSLASLGAGACGEMGPDGRGRGCWGRLVLVSRVGGGREGCGPWGQFVLKRGSVPG